MITISVDSAQIGGAYCSSNFSGSAGGAPVYSRIYFYVPVAPVISTCSIPGGYLNQGEKRWGMLGDTAVQHQRASGQVDITSYSLVPYTVSGVQAFKSGTTLVPYEIFCAWGSESMSTLTRDPYTSPYPGIGGMFTVELGESTIIHRFTMLTPDICRSSMTIMYPAYDTYQRYPYGDRYIGHTAAHTSTQTCCGTFINGVFKTRQLLPGDMTDSAALTYLASNGYNVTVSPLGSLEQVCEGTPEELQALATDYIVTGNYQCLAPWFAYHPADFGVLAYQASQSLKYVEDNVLLIVQDLLSLKSDPNSIRNLFQLHEWLNLKNIVQDLRKGKATIAQVRKAARTFSKVYLTWKYDVAPNLNDLSKIGHGLSLAMFDDLQQRVHSRLVTSIPLFNGRIMRHTAVFTAECKTLGERDWSMLQEFIYLGKRWGGYPELENLWDILIWSFVVDWFVQYGDFFKQIDAYLNTENYFPVKYCICSEKYEVQIAAADLVPLNGVSGEVDVIYYNRWINEEIPLPSIDLSADIALSNHWAEVGALVAGRRPSP